MSMHHPLGLSLFIKQQASYSKLQAILRMLLGQVYILLPHLFVLIFFALWGGVLQFLAWWSILFTEKYPVSWFEYQVKLQRWNMRVLARMMHLSDGYPAFGLDKQDDAIVYEVAYPEKLSRGKLLLKTFLGIFLYIPHLFCLIFRLIATWFLVIITPFSIVFTGNYPSSWHRFNVGTLRWFSRVGLYFGFLRDEYPPFYGKTNSTTGTTETESASKEVIAPVVAAAVASSVAAQNFETKQKTILVRNPDGTIVKKVIDEKVPVSSQSTESKINPQSNIPAPKPVQAGEPKTQIKDPQTANTTMNPKPTEEKKSKWPMILAILLFLTLAGLIWLFNGYNNLDQKYNGLLSEKSYNEEKYKLTLDSLQMLIENLNSEALMLRDQIEHPEKNEKYKGLMDEYNSLKDRLNQLQIGGNGGGSSKLKKEIAALKIRIEQLEQEIINYKSQITGLETEKASLTENVNTTRKKAEEYKNNADGLQKQIDEAALLDFEDIISGGIKYKSEEKKKDKPKAKSLNKIQVCFSIAANKIAKPGPRDIYVRIIDPSGQALKRGDQKFSIDGQELEYTVLKTQQYSNKEELVCMYYDRNDDSLAKGSYSVEIYAEGRKVGESRFTLK